MDYESTYKFDLIHNKGNVTNIYIEVTIHEDADDWFIRGRQNENFNKGLNRSSLHSYNPYSVKQMGEYTFEELIGIANAILTGSLLPTAIDEYPEKYETILNYHGAEYTGSLIDRSGNMTTFDSGSISSPHMYDPSYRIRINKT